jgi:hypothetical protein
VGLGRGQSTWGGGSDPILYIRKCVSNNLNAAGDAGINHAVVKRSVFYMRYVYVYVLIVQYLVFLCIEPHYVPVLNRFSCISQVNLWVVGCVF